MRSLQSTLRLYSTPPPPATPRFPRAPKALVRTVRVSLAKTCLCLQSMYGYTKVPRARLIGVLRS